MIKKSFRLDENLMRDINEILIREKCINKSVNLSYVFRKLLYIGVREYRKNIKK